ncbi:MAG: hypothetical protein K5787_08005 [Lentisphaeria bacterium]|nr:hypothetical protein [Lentisphaeria bacterium]
MVSNTIKIARFPLLSKRFSKKNEKKFTFFPENGGFFLKTIGIDLRFLENLEKLETTQPAKKIRQGVMQWLFWGGIEANSLCRRLAFYMVMFFLPP